MYGGHRTASMLARLYAHLFVRPSQSEGKKMLKRADWLARILPNKDMATLSAKEMT